MSGDVSIRPTPSDEEAAAIAAAAQVLWLGQGGGDEGTAKLALGNARRWRFSGRWWRQPLPLRRERPRL